MSTVSFEESLKSISFVQDQIDDLIFDLIKERKKQKKTQINLSHETGIPQATISRIESFSCNPSLQVLIKLSNALGLTLSLFNMKG